MAHINLLPWRELKRKEQQKQFFTTLGAAALFGAFCIAATHGVMSSLIENQQSRNNTLSSEIKVIDKRIRDIKELEKTKQALLDRMDIIQQLQRSRPVAVHLFDELVTTLPGGLYLTRIQQKGNTLEIHGIAESDARVSNYMRNLDDSPWMRDPKLEVIETASQDKKSNSTPLRAFVLKVDKEMPDTETNNEGKHGS
jgi:type IV pilus assembly protein PilN